MLITVYGKEVFFTNNEINLFKNFGLDIDSEFLELILYWNNIESFKDIDFNNIHDLCINSIKNYANIVSLTLMNIV